jgi:hypothetical protein
MRVWTERPPSDVHLPFRVHPAVLASITTVRETVNVLPRGILVTAKAPGAVVTTVQELFLCMTAFLTAVVCRYRTTKVGKSSRTQSPSRQISTGLIMLLQLYVHDGNVFDYENTALAALRSCWGLRGDVQCRTCQELPTPPAL